MHREPNLIEKLLHEIFGDQSTRPNNFTLSMGEIIRNTRESKGWSQSRLAQAISMRRPTLSDIENGKTEPSASQLVYLAASLEKPIGFFFPRHLRTQIPFDKLSPEELELLSNFREIVDDKLKQIAVNQVKSLSEFDPVEVLLEWFEEAEDRHDVHLALIKRREDKKKK